MEPTQVCRLPKFLIPFGALFFLAGVLVQFKTTPQALGIEPMWISEGEGANAARHPAAPWGRVLFGLFFPVAFWGTGGWILLAQRNYRAEFNNERIRCFDWLNRPTLDTRWKDLVSVELNEDSDGDWLRLSDGVRRASLTGFAEMEKIKAALRIHVPKLLV